MAVTNTIDDVALKIKYADGKNDDGSTNIKSASYSCIKKAATDQQIYDAGKAIADMMSDYLSINKTVYSLLLNS